VKAGGCVTVVTGAGGFLGGSALRALSPPPGGGRVIGCVREASGGPDLPPGVEQVVADLASADGPRRLRASLSGEDAGPVRLVLLAGGYRPGESGVNVEVTLAALEAAADRVQHIVYASSVAVYGSHLLHWREGRPQVAPDTCYGWSKRLAECALGLFARDSGVPVAILRLSSLYGRGNPGGNAVAALTRAVAEKRPFVIATGSAGSGDGALYARDYLWVDDAARAVAAASRSGFAGELDVGSGHTASPRDLAELLRAAGHQVTVDDRAPGSPVVRFGYDPGPALAALGVAPPRELADGIADELAWRMSQGAQ